MYHCVTMVIEEGLRGRSMARFAKIFTADGERGGPRGVWEGGGDQAAARPWRAERRRQSVWLRRRQRGSEGGPGTAARLGERPGDGSTARREARRRQRSSEGGAEVAARFGGRRCGSKSGSAVRSRRQCSHSKSHSPFL